MANQARRSEPLTHPPLEEQLIAADARRAASNLTAHVAEADPHTQYLLETAAAALYEPLDSDLTAIAALATTAYGRSFLTQADAAAARSYIGSVIGTNVQAYDATLSALAAFNSNGMLCQTAADTFAARTLTGTSSQVTVTNGNGVAGNPTISLPDTLVLGSAGGGSVSVTVRGEAATQFNVFRYSADATQPQITFNKSRGTIASPSYPNTSDVLGQVKFQGNAAFGADIRAVAVAATPGAADMYTRLEFGTAGSGSVSRTVRFKMGELGLLDASDNVLMDTSGRINIGAASERTAAQIADKTNAINTTTKYRGKLVWDTTNTRLMRASNTSDVSPWHCVDGSVTVTPA